MKEKRKDITEKQVGGGGGSVFDGVPDPIQQAKTCTVSSGPYSESLPVAGMTIGEIRRKFGQRMDIDAQSQGIVSGRGHNEDYVMNEGESLMFVRHAGEKGGMTVHIEGETAKVGTGGGTMSVTDLLKRCGPVMSTGEVVLPFGVKTVLSQGNITLWVWEQPPCIQRLSWIKPDSPAPYGSSATYRYVRIALPYLIIVAPFVREDNGMPKLMLQDECFFRTEPLKSLDDELSYPGLLNCSRWPEVEGMDHPLSWICTQYLKRNRLMASKDPGDRFRASFEAVRYCLLETSFNLSSEHHEGNSWYGASKKIDPRIQTVEKWEEATKQEPLFALEVPWIKSGFSVRKLAARMFQQYGSAAGTPTTADDIARIIINQS